VKTGTGMTSEKAEESQILMNITLNGEKKNVPDDVTVTGLLEFLKIQHQRVAVELNMEIVKKDRYTSTALKEGDSVEIVSFMGGG
jgi:thiamine biosynthesis protein ThiS